MKTPPYLRLALAASLLMAAPLSAQTTVFHYRVNDTDTAGLPTIPSVGGSDGTAIGATPFNTDIPVVGVPAGAGNRSLQGAGLTGGGVNSAGTQELLNADVVANGGFTFEAWFKWNGGGTVNSIIDYAGTEKFRIHTGVAGDLDMHFDFGSGTQVLATSPTVGSWHYVALVFEHDGNPEVDGQISGTATWYFDDVVATGSAPVTKDDFGDSLNRAIGVGRHPQGAGGDDFDGLIYEPRVTLGALTPSEFLYESTPTSDPQLVASTSIQEASDGSAIQFNVPITTFPGTTLDLILTPPGLSGPDAADFSVNSFDTPITADGGTGNIVIDFTPSGGDGLYEATLTINSNDPANPAFEVALSVEVREPADVSTVLHFRVNDTDEATVTGGTVPGADGAPAGTVAFGANLGLSTDLPTEGVPAGAGNRSLAFDGTQAVTIPGTQQLAQAEVIAVGGFTYELWFKWAGNGTVNSLIDYAGTEKFRIPTADGFPLDMIFDSGSGPQVLVSAPSADEWHYIAAVFEHDGNPELDGQVSGTLTWYYDGNEAVDTVNVTKDDFGDSLDRTIGVGGHPLGFGADFFNGLIYEPRVSLGALAPNELLYGNMGGGGFRITDFIYSPGNNMLTLTWASNVTEIYSVRYSSDLMDWSADLGDNFTMAADDENPDDGDHLTVTIDLSIFGIQNEPDLFYRVQEE